MHFFCEVGKEWLWRRGRENERGWHGTLAAGTFPEWPVVGKMDFADMEFDCLKTVWAHISHGKFSCPKCSSVGRPLIRKTGRTDPSYV